MIKTNKLSYKSINFLSNITEIDGNDYYLTNNNYESYFVVYNYGKLILDYPSNYTNYTNINSDVGLSLTVFIPPSTSLLYPNVLDNEGSIAQLSSISEDLFNINGTTTRQIYLPTPYYIKLLGYNSKWYVIDKSECEEYL